jgi:hypothetical protein
MGDIYQEFDRAMVDDESPDRPQTFQKIGATVVSDIRWPGAGKLELGLAKYEMNSASNLKIFFLSYGRNKYANYFDCASFHANNGKYFASTYQSISFLHALRYFRTSSTLHS